jgi:hypothetical protein
MFHYHSDSDQHGEQAQIAIVDAFYGVIKEIVREHLAHPADHSASTDY